MNGPRILCAGCGEPTSGINAICDKCMTPAGEVPKAYCALCEAGLPLGRHGMHATPTGGYAGKCTDIFSADTADTSNPSHTGD
jgi:hypothetical protein